MTTKKKKKILCNFLEQYFKEEKCQLMLLYQNFQIMLQSTTALFSAWGVTPCPGDTALHTDTSRLFLPRGLLLSSFSAYGCQDTLPQSACCHPSSAPELQLAAQVVGKADRALVPRQVWKCLLQQRIGKFHFQLIGVSEFHPATSSETPDDQLHWFSCY